MSENQDQILRNIQGPINLRTFIANALGRLAMKSNITIQDITDTATQIQRAITGLPANSPLIASAHAGLFNLILSRARLPRLIRIPDYQPPQNRPENDQEAEAEADQRPPGWQVGNWADEPDSLENQPPQFPLCECATCKAKRNK